MKNWFKKWNLRLQRLYLVFYKKYEEVVLLRLEKEKLEADLKRLEVKNRQREQDNKDSVRDS